MNVSSTYGSNPGMTTAKIPARRLAAFFLANAVVMMFFDAFWLAGFRVQALDDLSGALGYFQFALWFACFFFVSLLVLKNSVIASVALACTFTFALYLFIGVSSAVLLPYVDPWY
jgi:hypothetical protein